MGKLCYNHSVLRFLLRVLFVLHTSTAFLPAAEVAVLRIKLFPPNYDLYYKDRLLEARKSGDFGREYVLTSGHYRLCALAPGYKAKWIDVFLEGNCFIEEKLEKREGKFRLLAEIGTGKQPKSVAFGPEGKRLFVANLSGPGFDVFSLDPPTFKRSVLIPPLGKGPSKGEKPFPDGGRVGPENGKGFVETAFRNGNKGNELWISQMTKGQVHAFDLDSLELLNSIDCGGSWPKVICASPDQKRIYVSNWLTHDISVIDGEEKRLLSRIKVSGTPRGMAIDSRTDLLYVCLFDTGNIDIIDCKIKRCIRTLELGPGAKRHIVIDEDSDRAYVSDMYTGRVSVISLKENREIVSRRVGSNINTIKLSPDGRYLFVSVRGKNNPESYLYKGPEFGYVAVLKTHDLSLFTRIPGRNQTTGLAVSPDFRLLAFSDFLDDNLEIYSIDLP